MIRINLIPPFDRKPDSTKILLDVALGAALFAGCYFVVQHFADINNAEVVKLQQEAQAKEKEIKALGQQANATKELQKKLSDLQERQSGILRLSQGRQHPVMVLDMLQQIHSTRIWLEALAMRKEKIEISGKALDNSVISDYVRRIKLINNYDAQSISDIRNFTPKFSTLYKQIQNDVKTNKKDIVNFKNVELKNTEIEDIDGKQVLKFSVQFNYSS